jgi:hypothetical protein
VKPALRSTCDAVVMLTVTWNIRPINVQTRASVQR